jgi:hypothetical protein
MSNLNWKIDKNFGIKKDIDSLIYQIGIENKKIELGTPNQNSLIHSMLFFYFDA